jgi:hypothetical protein
VLRCCRTACCRLRHRHSPSPELPAVACFGLITTTRTTRPRFVPSPDATGLLAHYQIPSPLASPIATVAGGDQGFPIGYFPFAIHEASATWMSHPPRPGPPLHMQLGLFTLWSTWVDDARSTRSPPPSRALQPFGPQGSGLRVRGSTYLCTRRLGVLSVFSKWACIRFRVPRRRLLHNPSPTD